MRIAALALALALHPDVNCGPITQPDGGLPPDADAGATEPWTPADGAPACSTLPACVGLVYPTAAYGSLCESPSGPSFEPTTWRGAPVCCASIDGGAPVVIASCVSRPFAASPCDPAFPVASCTSTLVCGTDPSCASWCCH